MPLLAALPASAQAPSPATLPAAEPPTSAAIEATEAGVAITAPASATATASPSTSPEAPTGSRMTPAETATAALPTETASATDTPAPSDTPSTTPTPSLTPTPTATPNAQIVNGTFEAGPGEGWSEVSATGRPIVEDSYHGALTRHGRWSAWLGGSLNDDDRLEQTVYVSPDMPILTYWYWIESEDRCIYDTGRLLVNDMAVVTYTLCIPNNSDDWTKQTIDLGPFASQTVLLSFEVQTNDILNSSLYVDDVALEGSAAALPAAERPSAAAHVQLASWHTDPRSVPAPAPALPEDAQIVNGDFEAGPHVGWTESSGKGYPIILSFSTNGMLVHAGFWGAWLGGVLSDTTVITQVVTIPPQTPLLTYWHWIQSSDYCSLDYSVARVRVDNTVVRSYFLCAPTNTDDWVKQVIDLRRYVGQTVVLGFEVKVDQWISSDLYIDDVVLEPGFFTFLPIVRR